MSAPARELVGASIARLLVSTGVTDLVADRIWHRAPEESVFPYIADFDTDGLRDDATCLRRTVVTMNVHVWTRNGIDPLQDARGIAHAVAEALHGYPLALPGNRLVTLDHRGERVFYARDGLTGQGVVEFRAIISAT